MKDELSQAYDDYLDGSYDSPDRIVLNAYFRRGHIPGGFRNWWRELYGNDGELDNAHLMRLAGRFSRRVRAYGKKSGIPVIDCKPGERKAEIAKQYQPQDPNYVGVYAILVGRASAQPGRCKDTKKAIFKIWRTNIAWLIIITFI